MTPPTTGAVRGDGTRASLPLREIIGTRSEGAFDGALVAVLSCGHTHPLEYVSRSHVRTSLVKKSGRLRAATYCRRCAAEAEAGGAAGAGMAVEARELPGERGSWGPGDRRKGAANECGTEADSNSASRGSDS